MLDQSCSDLGYRNSQPHSNASTSDFLDLPSSANGPPHRTQFPYPTGVNHRHFLPHHHSLRPHLRPIPRPLPSQIHPPPKWHYPAPTNGRRHNLRRSLHGHRRLNRDGSKKPSQCRRRFHVCILADTAILPYGSL